MDFVPQLSGTVQETVFIENDETIVNHCGILMLCNHTFFSPSGMSVVAVRFRISVRLE